MLGRRTLLAAGAVALARPAIGRAQPGPVRVGMCTTLSGPEGYTGRDIRDGFLLAMAGGRLGGIPAELVVEDDGLDPARAHQIIARFVNVLGVRLYTGIVFTNMLESVIGDILGAGGVYISPCAAPASLAGKGCDPDYYVMSWQNDAPFESAGENANLLGRKRMYLLAGDYQAGRDAVAAFKRHYRGAIAGEVYTSLAASDYGPEIAAIRAARPDAVFAYQPGRLGPAFILQYHSAGLAALAPLVLAEPSLDAAMLQTLGDAGLGIEVSAHWNTDFDNVANRHFMTDFPAKYHRMPTWYASLGYDTGLALGAALYLTKGQVEDTEAFRQAMLPAQFESVRGGFRFNRNQEPIEDWWGLRVEKNAGGRPALATKRRVFKDHEDVYAKDCKL